MHYVISVLASHWSVVIVVCNSGGMLFSWLVSVLDLVGLNFSFHFVAQLPQIFSSVVVLLVCLLLALHRPQIGGCLRLRH